MPETVNTETGEIVRVESNLFAVPSGDVISRASAVAAALAKVLADRKLYSVIQGRNYVRVEGWTLLGSMMGVFPVCTWSKPVDGGWEARVEARTLAGAVVGAAEAQCTRSEGTWAKRDDYAIRSMAQTRATAKALRLPLGFIVAMAGYETTPSEEMPREGFAEEDTPHGLCPAHKVPYFQKGKMSAPAHKTDDGQWCNKPSVKDETIRLLNAAAPTTAERRDLAAELVPSISGKDPRDITDGEWMALRDALLDAGPTGPDVGDLPWDGEKK